VVGLVEGVAEATSSLLKLASGRLADRGWNAKRLVLAGYGTSNVARPLIGLAAGWGWVLSLRFLDRVGKGLRTSPRDAMIAVSAQGPTLGRAFGFHRAMDHAGSVAGPLLAFVLLGAGLELRSVFLASFVPGLLVLALLIWGLEGRAAPAVPPDARGLDPRAGWAATNRRFRVLLAATGTLALATTPEAFLVLWARAGGLEIAWVPLLWAAASGVKSAAAIPGGARSDRFGRRPVLCLGWGLRLVILIALGLVDPGPIGIWTLFLAYSGSLALTEGAERALVGDCAPAGARASCFGLYHLVVGLAALPGGLLFGLLWQESGATTAFFAAAALTAVAVLIVLRLDSPGEKAP
jgi:MFS family permease